MLYCTPFYGLGQVFASFYLAKTNKKFGDPGSVYEQNVKLMRHDKICVRTLYYSILISSALSHLLRQQS